VPIGVTAKRRGDDLFREHLGRLVLTSLALGQNHGAFSLDLVRIKERCGHAVRLVIEHEIGMIRGRGSVIGREISARHGVGIAAVLAHQAHDGSLGIAPGALEEHVLYPVRQACAVAHLVAAANTIPYPRADYRGGMRFADNDLQAVIQRRSLYADHRGMSPAM